MNYPVTNGYVAERLRRALEELHKGSVIYADIASLACYFQLSEDFAALTLRDQETIADMARAWVERDERIRRENEQRKRAGERTILMDNGGSMPPRAECREHVWEVNPGMYDTEHPYCARCGVAK